MRLPYDIATAEVIPELWERWLAWDYPTLVQRHADALRDMRAIYFDAGRRDEWFVDFTMEWMRQLLLPLRQQRETIDNLVAREGEIRKLVA